MDIPSSYHHLSMFSSFEEKMTVVGFLGAFVCLFVGFFLDVLLRFSVLILPALQHAGKHMEDCIVASYTALLLGCLCQESPVSSVLFYVS